MPDPGQSYHPSFSAKKRALVIAPTVYVYVLEPADSALSLEKDTQRAARLLRDSYDATNATSHLRRGTSEEAEAPRHLTHHRSAELAVNKVQRGANKEVRPPACQ